jgi:transposase
MATYCGVDFHARQQTITWCETQDGEIKQVQLNHQPRAAVQEFYARLAPPVIVGFETSGSSLWFEDLLSALGCEVRIGDPREIRRRARSRQKNDRRDADLLFDLLHKDAFPTLFRFSQASRAVLQQLRSRHKLVKLRTIARNCLHKLALDAGLSWQSQLLTKAGRAKLEALALRPVAAQQRTQWLELIDQLDAQIAGVEKALAPLAEQDPQVVRVRTHPGIGLLTGLALVHTLCPVSRFANSRKVTAYVGLEPLEHSSAGQQRWGGISKAGARLLRFLLGEAAHTACQHDADLRRFYQQLSVRRGPQKATVAVARKLLIRAYVLLREELDYAEFQRRAVAARPARGNAKPSGVTSCMLDA